MDERVYRVLMTTAIVLTVAWVGWSVYDGLFATRAPGDGAYLAAEIAFEDGHYGEAEGRYREALREAPDHVHAWRGLARTLLQQERYEDALNAFTEAIARAPDFGVTYANRGILYDRMGRHGEALADYERALALEPGVAKGPGWLTRFFRLQPEAPPTVVDRARYLREELAKPPEERLLRVPEVDRQQRPYKQ